MDRDNTKTFMEAFMRPTVFTGVKPLFIVAEELATKEHSGSVIDAVWVDWEHGSHNEFRYITKFAVEGKILNRKYYTPEDLKPYKGRLALPHTENFKKLVEHHTIKEEIEAVKALRHALADNIQKDFDAIAKLLRDDKEIFVFKKAFGDWVDPFYDIDIDTPYEMISSKSDELKRDQYMLKHPKTGQVKAYTIQKDFYAFIVGGKAEIAGLRLKDESYKARIGTLKDKARELFTGIEWLTLDDPRLLSIKESLPQHPFDTYFKYVKKGEERELNPPKELVQALEIIIEEHMPKFKGPLGVQYIPIDNLLYLLHEIIPRPEALRALEACDIIHEPSGLVLGYEGKHIMPPKFLVSVVHVAHAYKKFPAFIEACERYLNKD